MKIVRIAMVAVVGLLVLNPSLRGDQYINGITWQEPAIVTPGQSNAGPPSDAIVLYAGPADREKWTDIENWKSVGDVLISGKKDITTKQSFGDCQLHIEWSAPTPVKGNGQGRGNSGIFLMGRYEIQVLDSYQNKTYHDGQAGAIYKQTPPAVNATRPPGQWNTYDIFWTCPRFDSDGKLSEPAYITAVHNGVLILNHFALLGDTPFTRPPQYVDVGPKGPITLQDHGNPVQFRNIWVRSFKPAQGKQTQSPFMRNGSEKRPIQAETIYTRRSSEAAAD